MLDLHDITRAVFKDVNFRGALKLCHKKTDGQIPDNCPNGLDLLLNLTATSLRSSQRTHRLITIASALRGLREATESVAHLEASKTDLTETCERRFFEIARKKELEPLRQALAPPKVTRLLADEAFAAILAHAKRAHDFDIRRHLTYLITEGDPPKVSIKCPFDAAMRKTAHADGRPIVVLAGVVLRRLRTGNDPSSHVRTLLDSAHQVVRSLRMSEPPYSCEAVFHAASQLLGEVTSEALDALKSDRQFVLEEEAKPARRRARRLAGVLRNFNLAEAIDQTYNRVVSTIGTGDMT